MINIPEGRSDLPERNTMRGVLWMLVAVAGLAGIIVAVRALKPDLPVPQLLFLRAAIGLVVISAIMIPQKGIRNLITRRPGYQLMRNITHSGAQYCVFFGVIAVPIAEVTAIEYTIPMMTSAMAAIFLAEKVSRYRWIGMAVSFIGVLMIIRPGFADVPIEVLVVIGGAILFSLNNIMVKVLSNSDEAHTMVFTMNAMQIVLLAGPAWYVWVHPEWHHAPWIALLGVSGLITHYCISRALEYADTSVIFPLDFLRLPFIAVIAWVMWGETLSFWVVAGAGVIFASSYIAVRREAAEEKK